MFRTVALIACWSHDYWLDIRHEDLTIRSEDKGPNSHEFMLIDASPARPDDARTNEVAAKKRIDLPDIMDGHGEVHCVLVLDDEAWKRVVASAPSWIRRNAEADSRFATEEHLRADPGWLNLHGLDLEEALRMVTAAQVPVIPGDRYGMPADAKAASE
jgi:hypothetical protein